MNKAQIRTQLRALLNRNDCTNDQADAFIEQAVSRIQRTLRIPPMEKQEVITTNEDSPTLIVLPEDYLSIKHLYTEEEMLEYRDVATFIKLDLGAGIPKYYTRIQGGIQLKPTPPVGTVVNLIYYGEIPDLVNDSDENFLSIIAPDLLVYGALTYAADFFVDDRRQMFEERYSAVYNEVEEQSRLTEMEQATLAIQPAYPVL